MDAILKAIMGAVADMITPDSVMELGSAILKGSSETSTD